jgi:hypothetical protein
MYITPSDVTKTNQSSVPRGDNFAKRKPKRMTSGIIKVIA